MKNGREFCVEFMAAQIAARYFREEKKKYASLSVIHGPSRTYEIIVTSLAGGKTVEFMPRGSSSTIVAKNMENKIISLNTIHEYYNGVEKENQFARERYTVSLIYTSSLI